MALDMRDLGGSVRSALLNAAARAASTASVEARVESALELGIKNEVWQVAVGGGNMADEYGAGEALDVLESDSVGVSSEVEMQPHDEIKVEMQPNDEIEIEMQPHNEVEVETEAQSRDETEIKSPQCTLVKLSWKNKSSGPLRSHLLSTWQALAPVAAAQRDRRHDDRSSSMYVRNSSTCTGALPASLGEHSYSCDADEPMVVHVALTSTDLPSLESQAAIMQHAPIARALATLHSCGANHSRRSDGLSPSAPFAPTSAIEYTPPYTTTIARPMRSLSSLLAHIPPPVPPRALGLPSLQRRWLPVLPEARSLALVIRLQPPSASRSSMGDDVCLSRWMRPPSSALVVSAPLLTQTQL